jgi:hypothetical protein
MAGGEWMMRKGKGTWKGEGTGLSTWSGGEQMAG